MTLSALLPASSEGFATIALSRHQSAQGPVLRRFRDGRVEIDSGRGVITGYPTGTERAARQKSPTIWLPLFGGLH